MSLSKDHAIIAQNSATAAATLLQGTGATYDQFEVLRKSIFQGTVALGSAESVVVELGAPTPQPAPVSVAQAAPQAAPAAAPAPEASVLGDSGFSGQGDHGAGLAFKFGKFANKTIGQVGDEKPDYLVWIANGGMSNNTFMTGKVQEYLASRPDVRAAGEAAQATRAA